MLFWTAISSSILINFFLLAAWENCQNTAFFLKAATTSKTFASFTKFHVSSCYKYHSMKDHSCPFYNSYTEGCKNHFRVQNPDFWYNFKLIFWIFFEDISQDIMGKISSSDDGLKRVKKKTCADNELLFPSSSDRETFVIGKV